MGWPLEKQNMDFSKTKLLREKFSLVGNSLICGMLIIYKLYLIFLWIS